MANFISDGSVVPSHLSLSAKEEIGDVLHRKFKENYAMHIGYVVGKKHLANRPVYDVITQEINENGLETEVIYQNCALLDHFGGIADTGVATLRVAEKFEGFIDESVIKTASRVLLLCANGRADSAFIIGGVGRLNSIPVVEEFGHHLIYEFNGVRFLIDRDGQFAVVFRGATKPDGTLKETADPKAAGTRAVFELDGSVRIVTADDSQEVLINHSEGNIEITTTGKVLIQSSGVHVGDSTDAWVKGTTYRKAETKLMDTLKENLEKMSRMLLEAGNLLSGAGSSMASPITGAVAASAPITRVGNLLAEAATGPLAESVRALDEFESQAETYLSPKNLTD